MAKYAFVENNIVTGIYDELPMSWKNISNLPASDENYLKSLGWNIIIEQEFDFETQMKVNTQYEYKDGNVYEKSTIVSKQFTNVVDKPQYLIDEENWIKVRQERDQLMNDFSWRYERYDRQVRMNQPTTDKIEDLDEYMDLLANITITQTDPSNIVWPSYEEIVIKNKL